MAFDYGTKRIGVAIGQTLTATANPLAVVKVVDQQVDWLHIQRLIVEWAPQRLIVGLPQHADGTASDLTPCILAFTQQLHARFHLPVDTVDERLSSHAAQERQREAYFTATQSRKQRVQLDAIAAQIILETWLQLSP